MQKPFEISYGEGLGVPLTLDEGRRHLSAYAVAMPLEDRAGAVVEAIELQARIGVERSRLDEWQERGAVIGLVNDAAEPSSSFDPRCVVDV